MANAYLYRNRYCFRGLHCINPAFRSPLHRGKTAAGQPEKGAQPAKFYWLGAGWDGCVVLVKRCFAAIHNTYRDNLPTFNRYLGG